MATKAKKKTTKKATKKKATRKAVQWLVIMRQMMDDVPLRLIDNKTLAVEYAKGCKLHDPIEFADGDTYENSSCVAVMGFDAKGLPVDWNPVERDDDF